MMGRPARTSILLDLRSTLAAITVANGYKTTVVTCDEIPKPIEDVPEAQRPYLSFGVGAERISHMHMNVIDCIMPVVVVGYIHATTWETKSSAINGLIDDVMTAINADITLNGNCMQTKIISVETNESDPDAGHDVWFVMDLEVQYQRSTGAS